MSDCTVCTTDSATSTFTLSQLKFQVLLLTSYSAHWLNAHINNVTDTHISGACEGNID